MTLDQIIEGIFETMKSCHADCSCYECPIKEYCDAYEKLLNETGGERK